MTARIIHRPGAAAHRPRLDKRLLSAAIATGGVALCAAVVLFFTSAKPDAEIVTAEDLRSATVEHVRSGSKVVLDEGAEVVYAGIRAPFDAEPLSDAAQSRNAELVAGKKVRLRFDDTIKDKKDRFVAYVFADGTMVNEQLVKEGLAFVQLTGDHRRFQKELLAAQADARKNRRGLWRLDAPPKENQYPADPKYGNFHRPSCEVVPNIKPERLVIYEQRNKALDLGLAPCPNCRP